MTDRKTDLVEEPTAGYGEVYTYTDYMKFQYEEMVELIYWVIMPRQEIVEVFLLEDGKYARKPIYTPEDIATPFTFPDLHIELAQIFPNS